MVKHGKALHRVGNIHDIDREKIARIKILKFAEGTCPVESTNQDFAMDVEKIEALLAKLEKA